MKIELNTLIILILMSSVLIYCYRHILLLDSRNQPVYVDNDHSPSSRLCQGEAEFIPLKPYKENDSLEDPMKKVFFLETSGRKFLAPRQMCAVESAARFAGFNKVIVLLKSQDLLTNNGTCFLLQ